MKKPKVFVSKKISKEVEEYIGKHCDYRIWQGKNKLTYAEILNEIEDVDGLLLSVIKVDENLLNHAPNLKVISNTTVGYNNFDLKAMKDRGIIGTNTAGSLDDTVADLILGLIISTARRFIELDKYVRDGKWEKGDEEVFFGKDVSGSSLGIIGMGRIGEKVAKRAKYGFDMDIYYYNRNRKVDVEESLGASYLDFDTLLKTCDFILAMTPLTDETYHLIDAREFSLMRKDAIFINASRGKVVNQEAMIKALENKEILGAGLDVFEKEPIEKDSPLLSIPNVVLLPHIGSATEKTRSNMAMVGARNLVQALNGEIPDNIVPELVDTVKK